MCLIISKDAIKIPYNFNSEENVAKEMRSIFPGNVSLIIGEYAVDLETCPICLRDLVYPVILGCGHLFDLDCISNWAKIKNCCPLCRENISKIQYAEEVIKKVSAVFNFRFLCSAQIDPITINVYSSVQRIKTLVSLVVTTGERNLIAAAFSPEAETMPRNFVMICSSEKMVSRRTYSNTLLSDYEGIKAGGVYTAYFVAKLAQYGLPCDRCFSNPELEQTCNHPDEEDTTGI